MPTPDIYGQGIGLWAMTDAPSIPDAIAAFAKGALPRLRLTFASASARGATLVGAAAPVPGMTTWLTDVARLEIWDGSTWGVVATGARAWNSITVTSGWTQNGNSQGTFQYRLVNMFGEDTLMFRGGLSRSSYPTTIPAYFELNTTALPAAARPASLRTILVPVSDAGSTRLAMKLDITVDGWLRLYGVNRPYDLPAWVGFNGTVVSL
ncbi:hypothetical protein ACGFZR_14965 [Streptomyces sp. NPDC048241]|uniref:hypothetical protein n=1 Tax=Streptomyces sp. NPDC048241 TaxID=3365521 RepID=UPI00371AF1BC